MIAVRASLSLPSASETTSTPSTCKSWRRAGGREFKWAMLETGDEIVIGAHCLRFEQAAEAGPPAP
jgi:hypothetical protein